MNEQISFFLLWMNTLMRQQSNLELLMIKTYENSLNKQTNWLEMAPHGEQNQGCSTGEVCWNYFCNFALVLIYESKMDQN